MFHTTVILFIHLCMFLRLFYFFIRIIIWLFKKKYIFLKIVSWKSAQFFFFFIHTTKSSWRRAQYFRFIIPSFVCNGNPNINNIAYCSSFILFLQLIHANYLPLYTQMCLSLILLYSWICCLYAYVYTQGVCIKLVPLKFGVSERFTTVERIEDTESSL